MMTTEVFSDTETIVYDPADAQKMQKDFADAVTRAQSGHHPVNRPKHYTNHPSGVECIAITRHMGFNLGNAMKYIWRCDLKKDAIEDLEKAVWYLQDEIAERKRAKAI